jgi:hypothetical protein
MTQSAVTNASPNSSSAVSSPDAFFFPALLLRLPAVCGAACWGAILPFCGLLQLPGLQRVLLCAALSKAVGQLSVA